MHRHELTHALAKVDGLRVAARTSAFAFKGKQQDIRKIGEQLGVGAVLEGSVRKAGDRLRITVQLIEVADGFHLWSETFDRDLADVFEVQDEISHAVISALRIQLRTEPARPLVVPSTESLRAYELYLTARFFSNRRDEVNLRKAVEQFEQALEVDPDYALAYAGLAEAYSALWNYGFAAREEVFANAKRAALKALELDDGIAEAHTALAYTLELEWDWEGAAAPRVRGGGGQGALGCGTRTTTEAGTP